MKSISLANYLRLALRQVRRHQRKSLATGGFILVGTAVLVVLVGITVGINDAMITNSVRLHSGQIFIEIPAGSDTVGLAEALNTKGRPETLLQRRRFSVLLKGPKGAAPGTAYAVDPVLEAAATAIAGRTQLGRYLAAGEDEILVGSDLADTLGVTAGSDLSLWSATAQSLGHLRVCGIYHTGIAHFDRNVVYLTQGPLDNTVADAATEFALFYASEATLESVAQDLKAHLPADGRLDTWQTLMPDLVQLIEMNAVSMGIVLVLVYGLVGFGISNTFVLTIVERYREFGILKAMGMRPGELEKLICRESFFVCLTATALGLSAGWLLTEFLGLTGIDLTRWTSHNRYFLVTGVIHPRATIAGLVWPATVALIVSLLAAYLPTRICRRRSTADLLRNN